MTGIYFSRFLLSYVAENQYKEFMMNNHNQSYMNTI